MTYESSPLWAAYFFFIGLTFVTIQYFASIIPIYILAKKTNTPNAWLAWIPIGNFFLLCKIGEKPGWWVLLLLIPFIQIIFFILVWMGVCYVRNKPSWLGFLIIIPLVNFILPWYLALADKD